jgi:putative SOS response-associated peptidase YedK
MTWGLVPPWAKDPAIGSQMINARSETVTEKPSFRHAIRYRRCVIPSSGFFEWLREGKNKTPMYIYRKNGSPLGFAGIWEEWQALDGSRLDTFALLTTTANKLVAPIHDRMTKTELITQIAENSNKEGMTKADLADKIHEHLYYLNGSTNKNAMT